MTSSPHYPQSNGLAEKAIQTVKKLLKESDDPFMALLNYQTTPFPWCNLSPAELLMGRRLRSNLSLSKEQLIPVWPYLEEFARQDNKFKQRQKHDYDKRHCVIPLPSFSNDTPVWIETNGNHSPGAITTQDSSPHSYWVNSPSGNNVCRNHRHLLPRPSEVSVPEEQEPSSCTRTGSQTGTVINPPDRYSPSHH